MCIKERRKRGGQKKAVRCDIRILEMLYVLSTRETRMNESGERTSPPDGRQRVDQRKQLLDQEMKRCVRLLTEHGTPEKVILFGTLATGGIHGWSDIDMVVVERTNLPFFQRMKLVRNLLQPKVGMDIMVYTPEEFERLRVKSPFFRDEIIGKGIILYERNR